MLSCITENFSDGDEESVLGPENALVCGEIVVGVRCGFLVEGLFLLGVVLASFSGRNPPPLA